MCLAVPMKITALLGDDMAEVEMAGVRKTVSLMLLDGAAVGDHVIIHTGFALSKLDPDEAAKTLALFEEAGML